MTARLRARRSTVWAACAALGLSLLGSAPAAFGQDRGGQGRPAPASKAQHDDGPAAGEGAAQGRKELRQAAMTGKRVEIPSLRGANEQVFAQPNGHLVSEITAGPRFAPQPDGSWKDIDTTLEVKPDGSVGPKVASSGVRFSGGGTGPLLSVVDGKKSAALDWPGPLPRPALRGDTAVYRNVLPGLDLKMRATAEGFRQVLVVRTAQAAKSPALQKIRLTQHGHGLRFTGSTRQGRAERDGKAGKASSGAAALMWDSGSEAPPASGSAAAQAATRAAGGNDPALAPRPGDRQAEAGMRVDSAAVTLAPGTGLLRAKNTAFPVYIAPPLSVEKPSQNASRSFYTWANSAYPDQENANFDDDHGIGRCTVNCSYTSRMYFEYSLAGWQHRTIYKATFSAYETFSYSCTPTWVGLYLVDAGKLSKSTNWNNKPANGDLMVDRKVAYGNEQFGCENAWLNFSDNAEETNENLTPTVRSKAASGAAIAFSLSAKDEGDADGWKRFKGDTGKLSIEYNTPPGTPTNAHTTSPTTSCAAGADRPYIRDDSPVLTVNANDADAQNIRVLYRAFESVPDAPDTQVYGDLWTPYKADGTFEAALPTGKLKHGRQYYWHAQSTDGIATSAWSGWCEFNFDNVAPTTAPSVVPPADAGQLTPGQNGLFRFGANGSKDPAYGNDVEHYLWGVNTDTPANKAVPSALGADAVDVPVPIVKFGINVLSVRSVDRAGNAGPVERFVFQAGRACADPPSDACAAAAYKLDESSGTTAADAGAGGNALPLTGTTWVAGDKGGTDPADRAAHFTGTSGSYGTRASLVDTRQGLTVMAWAKVTDLSADHTVLSQSGTIGNGYALAYSKTGGWTFSRHRSATGTDEARAATGKPQDVQAGQWVHLAGVFDPSKNEIDLYVNGELAASDSVIPSVDRGTALDPTQVWHADQGFQLGRGKWNGVFGAPWAGDLDDVRVYPTVLDRSDIYLLSMR